MHKNMIHIILYSMAIALASCTGQAASKQHATEFITEPLSKKDTSQTGVAQEENTHLAKIYSQAISDYITEVSKQELLLLDTLYFGKRNNGQPDDFPDIVLPETISNIKIRLVEPELGKTLQEEKKSRVYINLVGWVEEDNAEFIFVTFSNGFEHKFDYHIYYKYNSARMEYDITTSKIEVFDKK